MFNIPNAPVYQVPETADYLGGSFSTAVLRHNDICQPSYDHSSHSKCPRAVIEVVGNLLVGKMAFNAVAGPAITLAMYSPIVRGLAERVHARLGSRLSHWSLDKEVASIVMLLDIVLVMGFRIIQGHDIV